MKYSTFWDIFWNKLVIVVSFSWRRDSFLLEHCKLESQELKIFWKKRLKFVLDFLIFHVFKKHVLFSRKASNWVHSEYKSWICVFCMQFNQICLVGGQWFEGIFNLTNLANLAKVMRDFLKESRNLARFKKCEISPTLIAIEPRFKGPRL